jgi:hypothetical protein
MLTPKAKQKKKNSSGRYVLNEVGELVLASENTMAGNVNFRVEKGIDSDMLKKHYSLLRRQHFMDRH